MKVSGNPIELYRPLADFIVTHPEMVVGAIYGYIFTSPSFSVFVDQYQGPEFHIERAYQEYERYLADLNYNIWGCSGIGC